MPEILTKKPRKPTAPHGPPKKPQEWYYKDNSIQEKIEINDNCGSDGSVYVELDKVNELIAKAPNGGKAEKVCLSIACRAETEYGYYDEVYPQAIIESISISYSTKEFYSEIEYEESMNRYKEEMKTYERKMRRYNEMLEQYNKDIALWNKVTKK